MAERSAQMSTLTDEVTSLKKELNQAKASLDSKDSAISQLEDSLHSERQKVSVSFVIPAACSLFDNLNFHFLLCVLLKIIYQFIDW